MEVHNGSDIGIEIWQTNDGNPGNLEKVAWIEAPGEQFRYPHICQVQPNNDDFVIKFLDVNSENRSYLQIITYDGGQTWEGIYYYFNHGDYKSIITHKGLDTSDFHFTSLWQWDNSSFPDISYQLLYGWDSVKLFGYAYYEEIGGEPAPLTEVTVEELLHGAPPTIYAYNIDGNMYELFLLYGFQAFAIPSPAQLRVIMKDTSSSCSVNLLETTEELFFPEPYPYPHAVQFDSVVDIHYRDAKDFPHHYARVDTGASVMKMLLDYLGWNSSEWNWPQDVYDEQTLFDTYAGGDVIDGSEMAQGLNAELDAIMGDGYWYFFGHTTNDTSPNRPLMYMLLMMDYPVDWYHPGDPSYPPLNGHPHRVPAAVPINGTFETWVAVRGFHTDQASWPSYPQDVTIHGLWLNDPRVGGWSHTYVTGQTFLDDYYFMVDGEYHVVCDPPVGEEIPAAGADIAIAEQEEIFSARQQSMIKRAAKGAGGLTGLVSGNLVTGAAHDAYMEIFEIEQATIEELGIEALGDLTGIEYGADEISVSFTNAEVVVGYGGELLEFTTF
jgi:hypothetical protein